MMVSTCPLASTMARAPESATSPGDSVWYFLMPTFPRARVNCRLEGQFKLKSSLSRST